MQPLSIKCQQSLADEVIQPLTNGPNNDYHPSWSPDGRYIAFNRDILHIEEEQRRYEPYVYILDSTNNSEISLTKAIFDYVPFSTAEGWQQIWLMDPVWLPTADNSRLSLTQLPARCNEGGVVALFAIDWNHSPPVLSKLLEIAGGFEGYTWGPGGAWFISPEYDYHDQSIGSAQLDFSARYIEIEASHSESEVPTFDLISQQAPCLAFDQVEWLSKTSIYEFTPNWKP